MIPCIPAPRARSLAAAAAATILSLAFAAQAMAAPAYVKSASGSAATATSLAVSVPSVAAGDTLIASVRAQAGQSVSDSLNGAWTLAGETSDLLNGVWFLSNSKAGADTITLHGTTSGTMRIIATEYSGVGALATHACNTGTGTSVTNLNFANVAGQLAYASLGVFNQPITATADAGATIRTQFTGSNGTEAQEDLVTNGTARSMGFTLSSAPSGGWATCELLFDAGTGGDTTPPSVPSGLAASPGDAQASLSWTASSDSVGVAGYDVYRNGVNVGSTAATSYTDTGLTNGTTYSYTVDAYDAAGNVSAQSSAVNVTPTGGGGGGNGTITFDGTFSPTDPGAGPHWTQVYGSSFSYIAANQEQFSPDTAPNNDGHYRIDICNSSSSGACDATSSHYTYAKATAYCTSIPFYLPRAIPTASGNQWYQIAEMKKSVEPGGGNWTIGIGGGGVPRLAFGFTGGAYNNTDAYRGPEPSTGVWHTASVCQNAGGTSSYAYYDGSRITYNVGSCSGSTTCTGVAMFGPCACSYLPLDINAYTGNTSGTDTWKGYVVTHGDPLVATIGSNGLPPEPPGGWNSP